MRFIPNPINGVSVVTLDTLLGAWNRYKTMHADEEAAFNGAGRCSPVLMQSVDRYMREYSTLSLQAVVEYPFIWSQFIETVQPRKVA